MATCPKCGKTYQDSVIVCPDDNTPLDSMLGKLLAGRYRLIEKIGEGGMGAIYKAVHTMMDRTCAIKLLTSVSARDEQAVARFNREARMASKIDNAHAVTIYDFGESEEGLLYLAMEYIEGEPLSRLLQREKVLRVDQVVSIVSQIAEALTAAHALGIIHRDLKPDNVMITRRGAETCYVKVLDFGIAKAVAEDSSDNLTKTGFVLGTPAYMSPEQLSGEQLDARSDVYSLAIMVYQMSSGRLPFEGDNPQAIMIKRITTNPISLRAVAPSASLPFHEAVMSALSRDPDERPATVERFVTELRAAEVGGTQVMGSSVTGGRGAQGVGSTLGWSDGGASVAAGYSERESADHPRGQDHTTPIEPLKEQTVIGGGRATVGYGSRTSASADRLYAPTVVDAAAVRRPERKSYSRILLFAIGAFVLVGALVYLFAFGPGQSGYSLVIDGAPAGSEVWINGSRFEAEWSNGKASVSGVPAGGAAVRVKKDGFSEFTADVNGADGDSHSIKAAMLPLAIDFGAPMMLIPAGEFVMGSDSGGLPNEIPSHPVRLDDYYLDKFEVSNEQYKKFCDATSHPYPVNKFDANYFTGNPAAPVVGVSFSDALAFAKWIGKRLPSEAEWEKAASWDQNAGAKRMWPWGNESRAENAHINKQGRPYFTAAGAVATDRSPYGLFDMAGNAAEWVDTLYEPYPGNRVADLDYSRKLRVVRGGCVLCRVSETRSTYRGHFEPQPDPDRLSKSVIGFRCAISAADEKLKAQLASYR